MSGIIIFFSQLYYHKAKIKILQTLQYVLQALKLTEVWRSGVYAYKIKMAAMPVLIIE